jgi:hypothetical protein
MAQPPRPWVLTGGVLGPTGAREELLPFPMDLVVVVVEGVAQLLGGRAERGVDAESSER